MIGIYIKINGTRVPLDLRDNFSISFEENNPIFDFESFPGRYSFFVPVDWSKSNQKLLGFSNKLEKSSRLRTIDCEVLIKGAIFVDGALNIITFLNDGWECSISFDKFPLQILDKNLRADVDYGPDVNLGANKEDIAQAAFDSNSQSYPEINYGFPLWSSPDFYQGANLDFSGVVNWNFPDSSTIGTNDNIDGNRFNIVPWIYRNYVMEKVAQQFGFQIGGDWWASEENRKMYLFNNKELAKGVTQVDSSVDAELIPNSFTVAEGVNSFSLVWNFETNDPDSNWNTQTSTYTIDRVGNHTFNINYALIAELFIRPGSPSLTFASNWLERVEFTFHIVMQGTVLFSEERTIEDIPSQTSPLLFINEILTFFFDADDIGKEIGFFILNVVAVPKFTINHVPEWNDFGSSNTISVEVGEIIVNEYDGILKYANHVPDVNITTLLLAIRDTENVDINYDSNNKLMLFNYIDDVINTVPKDISKNAISGRTNRSPKFEIREKRFDGFQIGFEFPQIDEGILSDPNNAENQHSIITVGNGRDRLTPSFTPVLMNRANFGTGEGGEIRYLTPVFNGPGSTSLFGLGESPVPLKIIYNRGIRLAEFFISGAFQNDVSYAFASPYLKDYKGNIVGDTEIRFNREITSIFSQFWQRFLEALSNGENIQMFFTMNIKEIQQLKVRDRLFIQSQVYLLIKKNYVLTQQDDRYNIRLSLLKYNPL